MRSSMKLRGSKKGSLRTGIDSSHKIGARAERPMLKTVVSQISKKSSRYSTRNLSKENRGSKRSSASLKRIRRTRSTKSVSKLSRKSNFESNLTKSHQSEAGYLASLNHPSGASLDQKSQQDYFRETGNLLRHSYGGLRDVPDNDFRVSSKKRFSKTLAPESIPMAECLEVGDTILNTAATEENLIHEKEEYRVPTFM